MQNCCDLEVDVNGEEIFLVDKNVLASFSGRLSKLFSQVRGETRRLKVVFNDFPGGAEGFDLIAKFCYNGGSVDLTPSNMFLLHAAAIYMEMSLIEQTKAYFRFIHSLNWFELISALKKCQELPSFLISSSVLQQLLDCVVGRLSIPCFSSPRVSSSDNSGILFSGDISIDSTRSFVSQTNWWFQDLKFLNIDMLEKAVRTMVSHKLDQTMISSFLSYYKNANFLSDKCRIIETIINLLSLLNRSFISVRGLFDILQASRSLKINKCCIEKLEVLIGSQLDRATIDDLLIPSQVGKRYVYDVNLILKLVKTFQRENSKYFFGYRLKKVGKLIDLYIMEVAPDEFLKPSKFRALATALPDTARDSYEILYEAIDVYFKVHKSLSAEEKIKISCALNYDKLPDQTLIDLSCNENFPVFASVTALVTNQSKLRIKHIAIENLSNFTDKSSRGEDKRVKKHDLQRKGKKLSRPNVQNRKKLQINVSNNFASMHRLCA